MREMRHQDSTCDAWREIDLLVSTVSEEIEADKDLEL